MTFELESALDGLGDKIGLGDRIGLVARISLGARIGPGARIGHGARISLEQPWSLDQPWMAIELGSALDGFGARIGLGARKICAWSLRSHALKHLSARFARTLRPLAFNSKAIKANISKAAESRPAQYFSEGSCRISASYVQISAMLLRSA